MHFPFFQTQQIGSSTHFLGQSSVVAHFGLGSNSGNVTVKVTWPSNLMVTYVNVTPNTRLRVVQPNRSVSNDYDDHDRSNGMLLKEIHFYLLLE